jgi:hypothetical protein
MMSVYQTAEFCFNSSCQLGYVVSENAAINLGIGGE